MPIFSVEKLSLDLKDYLGESLKQGLDNTWKKGRPLSVIQYRERQVQLIASRTSHWQILKIDPSK